MAQSDRLKWDKKFSNMDHQIENGEASYMLKKFYSQASGKRALDVACGTGRNALFLAAQGFEVDALDISPVGLARLKSSAEKISGAGVVNTVVTELEEYHPTRNSYDVIVATNYLNRRLIPELANALQVGGVLVLDTFASDKEKYTGDFNPDFLLQTGEFPTYFDASYTTLQFDEFNNDVNKFGMWKQVIAVQKRAS